MDFKKLFVQHGEKIGLAVAILVFIIVVAKTNIMPPEDVEMTGARQMAHEIEQRFDNDKPPKASMLDYAADNATKWQSVSPPKEANSWAIYRQTEYEADVQLAVKAAAKYFYAPKMLEPKLSLGKVTVMWDVDKRTTATVTGYKVHRKGPQGDWKLLTDTPLTGNSYTDDKVEAKRKYTYKVSAETKEPTVPEKERIKESEPIETTTLGVIQIVFRGGTIQMAQILVRKLDTGQEHIFFVKPGQMIGGVEILDIKGTKVDFSTGYKLNDIKKEKRRYVRTEKVKEWATDGKTYTEKEVEREDFKTEMRIYYADDEGKDCDMWAEAEMKKEPEKKDTEKKEGEQKEPKKTEGEHKEGEK
jgi:hypothetical protein